MSTFDKLSASVLDKLTEDMKTAMKARDSKRLGVIRMLISSVRYVQIDLPRGKAGPGEMSDEEMVAVLTKEAKKRRESIIAYREGGREEQAKQEEYELKVIGEYLPEQISEEEIRRVIKETLDNGNFLNVGSAIGVVMGKLKGSVDGGMVSRIVREEFKS